MKNEEFYKIERNTDVLDWSIEGIKIWRYERFMIHRYLHDVDSNGLVKSTIAKEYDNNKLSNYLNLYMKYPFKPNKKYKYLFLNHQRRALDGDTYVCKFTEKLSNYFDDSITYEVPFNEKHLEPIQTKNLKYYDRVILNSYGYEKFIRSFRRKKYLEIYNAILEKIKSVFGVVYDEKVYAYLAKSMTKNLFLIKYRMKKIRQMVKKVSPSVIIEVVGYSKNNMIINEIAKEERIPTIEIQHSQINDQMIQYMWGERKDIEQFPDYLFTFGEFWSEGLQLPISRQNVKAVGFPYFEEEIEKTKKKGFNEDIQSEIVFISQFLAGEAVYKLAIEYSKIDPKAKLIYKLHPEEYQIWEERYPLLKEYDNINVVLNPQVTLYDLFANTKAVVGVFSGALYEALAFDLPVYLLNADYIEYMQKLIDINGAVVVENAKELSECIVDNKRAKTPDLEIWKTNSLQNAINEINQIIDMKECV